MDRQGFRYIIIFPLACLVSFAYSQSTSSTQFSNELKFSRPLATRWSGELNFTSEWMQTPPADGLFDKYSQWSLGAWGHYYIASKWRISTGLYYYRAIALSEPAQDIRKELRLSGQGIYYVKKIGYTVISRSRLEWRNIKNAEDPFYSVLRLRQQVKMTVPINAKSIRRKVFYVFGSEEVYFKTPSDAGGDQVFDRNRFDVGMGYAITNDISVELYYANEFLPETNQINNIINLDFNFRNLINNLKKQLFEPPPPVPDE